MCIRDRSITDQEAGDIASYLTKLFGPESVLPKSPADMPGYKDTVRPVSSDALNIVYVAVSYTHLDVYKRQVLDGPRPGLGSIVGPSVAKIMHGLYEMIPKAAEPWCRSEAVVKYGDPSKQIVETAKERCAELIVLGVRDHANTLDIATHMDKATAHKVLVHALCPVLTLSLIHI